MVGGGGLIQLVRFGLRCIPGLIQIGQTSKTETSTMNQVDRLNDQVHTKGETEMHKYCVEVRRDVLVHRAI